jgi:hypothetical protein
MRRPPFIFGLTAALLAAAPASGQTSATVSEAQVKAAFLLNFPKFVSWPAGDAAPAKPFVIGLLGHDETGEAVRVLAQGKKLGDRPLVVRRFTLVSEVAECDLLYLAAVESRRAPVARAALRGRGVLTVGDWASFAREGGMIALATDKGRVAFVANPRAAREAGLAIGAQLLSLAQAVER